MKLVLNPDQMRAIDSSLINKYSIPSAVLMENAARSAAEYVIDILLKEKTKPHKILILCGSGNNGGDGFALARHLTDIFAVKVVWIGSEEKMSPETYMNFLAVQKLGLEITHVRDDVHLERIDFNADCIIDALIGVGGSGNLKGLIVPIIAKANESESLKIALDVPSGLDSLSGISGETAFRADSTITMFAFKLGMIRNNGLDLCGDISEAYLGAPESVFYDSADTFILEKSDIRPMLGTRKRVSSKFDYGKVLMVCGSDNMPGAAALCANSALAAGAGLVYLATTRLHPAINPGVIPYIMESNDQGGISLKSLDGILELANMADVIVIGPGLGDSLETVTLVTKLINEIKNRKKVLLDADALKAIDKKSKLGKNVLLTPHTGEFSRLTGVPRHEIETYSYEKAKEWAAKLNCNILLKHVPTIITNGSKTYINITGNPGMATAGSGDVLSGIIGGLLAQKLEILDASALGALIHSEAGDSFAGKFAMEPLRATDLIESIKYVLQGA